MQKNETENTSYIEAIDEKGFVVGVIEMHPNKKTPLDVKIIPVVLKSSEVKEKNAAISLYNKAIKAKTTHLGSDLYETLNKQSLNQAGIISEIETIKDDPERIVIDVNKDNWGNYYDSTKKEFKNWEFDPAEPNEVKRPAIWINEDGGKNYEYKEYEVEEKDVNGIVTGAKKVFQTKNNKRLLLDELEEAYYTIYGKDFKGALLFVTEENYYKPNTLGYSQNIPLRSQGTIIFKGGLSMSDAYAHELGHMLGLEHVFVEDNNELEKINNEMKSNSKFIAEIEEHIKREEPKFDKEIKFIQEKKDNYYNEYVKEVENKKERTDYEEGELKNDYQYLQELDEEIREVEESKKKFVQKHKDLIEEEYRKIKINPLVRIKQNTSNNFMDYYNSRLFFHRFQAIIMQREIKDFY